MVKAFELNNNKHFQNSSTNFIMNFMSIIPRYLNFETYEIIYYLLFFRSVKMRCAGSGRYETVVQNVSSKF